MLRAAQARGTALAVLLDRVPPGAGRRWARTCGRCSGAPVGRGSAVRGARGRAGRRPAPGAGGGAAAGLVRAAGRGRGAAGRGGPAHPGGRAGQRAPARRRAGRAGHRPGRRGAAAAREAGAAYADRADRRRGGHAGRRPAARRGARPVAGVRRHRRADAHPAGPGRAVAGPDHRGADRRPPPGQELAVALESGVVLLVDSAAGRPPSRRPGPGGPTGRRRLLRGPGSELARSSPASGPPPSARCGTGRPGCWTWCAGRAAPAAPRRGPPPTGSTPPGCSS